MAVHRKATNLIPSDKLMPVLGVGLGPSAEVEGKFALEQGQRNLSAIHATIVRNSSQTWPGTRISALDFVETPYCGCLKRVGFVLRTFWLACGFARIPHDLSVTRGFGPHRLWGRHGASRRAARMRHPLRSKISPMKVPPTISAAPISVAPVAASDRIAQDRAKPNSGSVPIRKLTRVGLLRRTAAFCT